MSYLRFGRLLNAETGEKVEITPPGYPDRYVADFLGQGEMGETARRKRAQESAAWCAKNGYEESRYYIFWEASSRTTRVEQELCIIWRRPEAEGEGEDVMEYRLTEPDARKIRAGKMSKSKLPGYGSESETHRKAISLAVDAWVSSMDEHYGRSRHQ